jgi:hypothetical protein
MPVAFKRTTTGRCAVGRARRAAGERGARSVADCHAQPSDGSERYRQRRVDRRLGLLSVSRRHGWTQWANLARVASVIGQRLVVNLEPVDRVRTKRVSGRRVKRAPIKQGKPLRRERAVV